MSNYELWSERNQKNDLESWRVWLIMIMAMWQRSTREVYTKHEPLSFNNSDQGPTGTASHSLIDKLPHVISQSADITKLFPEVHLTSTMTQANIGLNVTESADVLNKGFWHSASPLAESGELAR